MILTLNHRLYGLNYDINTEKYNTTEIKYDDNLEKAINEYTFKITKENEDYNSEESFKEIGKQRANQIIKKLETYIRNKQSHGDFKKANEPQTSIIKLLLEKHEVKNINKLFKGNEKESTEKTSNYQDNNKNKQEITATFECNGCGKRITLEQPEDNIILLPSDITITPRICGECGSNSFKLVDDSVGAFKYFNKLKKKQFKREKNIKREKKLLSGFVSDNGKGKAEDYTRLSTFDPEAKKNLATDLEEIYHLAYNLNDEKSYLFDYDKQTYIEIDKRGLQAFLGGKEYIRTDTVTADNIIKSTVKRINNNYDYIEFDNKLLNIKTGDYEDKTLGKNNPRPFITPKRIKYNLLESRNENFNETDSKIYTVLYQILGSEENVKDFEQRLGSSIFNKGKEITIYFNPEGNNGRTTLAFIRKLVLGGLARNTNSKQLLSEYNQKLLDRIHELIFDEIKEHSFKDTEEDLKKITGGGITEESRVIQSDEIRETRIDSMVSIFTNPLPEFNLNDTALFRRISIIKLQNRFTHLIKEVNNETVFLINEDIQDEISKDIEGIEHLINNSIYEYKLMKDRNEVFINKKGVEYARAFYFGNDHLINFLSVYTKLTEYETETTTAEEILNNYKQYLKTNNTDLMIDD